MGKLILPVNLTFSYPLWHIDWTKPLHYTWTLALVCAAALIWFFREKIGRGPIAAGLFFIATLAPVLGFVSIYTFYYSYVADHYVYMACIGPIALFAAAVSQIWHKSTAIKQNLISLCLAMVLIVFFALTWQQGHIYKDLETLWQDTLKKNPDSLLAHANMGLIEVDRGNTEQAMKHFYKALEIYPDDYVVPYNLGNIFKAQGKFDEAVAYYRKALRIQPDFVEAHKNLANVLKKQGKLDEAVEHYEKALMLKPQDSKTLYNLANIFREQGKFNEAVTAYQRSLELEPQFDYARTNLAVTLESMGRANEAISQYRKVLEINPNALIPLNALAELLANSSDPNVRDVNQAVRFAELAAGLTNYNDPVVLNTLAMAYASAGSKSKALTTAQKAIDLASAQGNIALADSIRKWIEQYQKSD
jgi:protein O-mannosyl-transferase